MEIKELLENYINNADSHAKIYIKDIFNVKAVLDRTEKDFLIFDNGGGSKFEIKFDMIYYDAESKTNQMSYVKDFIDHLLKKHKHWIYCYQLDGKQFILKPL